MTARTWIPSKSNLASDPQSWSGGRAPKPGDTLSIHSATSAMETMNIVGNALAGDLVTIGSLPNSGAWTPFTANLTSGGAMTATMYDSTATFNMSGNSTLHLTEYSGPPYGVDHATINMRDNDTLTLDDIGNSPTTVNLAAGAVWHGTINEHLGLMQIGSLTVNGLDWSHWDNNATSKIQAGTVKIGAQVTGNGSFVLSQASLSFPARLEFVGGIAQTESITNAGGVLVIDQPGAFAAHVTLAASHTAPEEIDIKNLFANPDSFSFKNDMLLVYSGGNVIERMSLHNGTGKALQVEHNPLGGLSVIAFNTTPIDPSLLLHRIG